jgi:AhpC/TSA family
VWQTLQNELGDAGFTIIAIALDADVDAVREWATVEPLSFPVLIDRDFVFAERYGIVNVPATVWIDEDGKVVRPADTAMGDDRFRAFSNVDSAVHHDKLRAWVNDGVRDLDDAAVREFQELPTEDVQLARLHRRVAMELRDRGDEAGVAEHLTAARALAPLDWTIRRGSMPLLGEDPFGNEFFGFVGEWMEAGRPGFRLGTGRDA